MDESEFVNVAIRIRPGDPHEENPCLRIISKHPPILLMPDRSQTFSFDQVFDQESNQEIVYEEAVRPLVKYVKQGYNCTVFAYGQTGTGKTFTIGTEPEVTEEINLGLIPRTLREFFQYDDSNECETEIFVSFIEIYNERVFDLLKNSSNPRLFVKGMKPQGFSQEKVYNLTEARHFLNMGNKNRHTAGTKQNAKSSRSHAIFTIHCNVKNKSVETNAKLNLVDLAGSESVKKTGNQGSTFHEGVNINKGLLSISQVMTALSTNSSFIPYRQSIITSVLQDSLNKRNFISLIACVSSLQEDSTETLQTLDFAQRLKKVKSRPEVNEVIAQYKKDNPNLFQFNKMGTTPFKRPTVHSHQTPAPIKRFKPLETTTEMNTINTESNHSPKSLFSLSHLSTFSSNYSDITQQVLSPVIKKYMSAMEASLMDKLETMIKSNMRRPNRELEFQKLEEKENIDCTPCVNWKQIRNEVTKIVKSEIVQLTTKSVHITSSPIEAEELNGIRKVLTYENSVDEDGLQSKDKTSGEKNLNLSDFKVPVVPSSRMKNHELKRLLSISPIENVPVNPRRSLRLSLKKIETSYDNIASQSRHFDTTLRKNDTSVVNDNVSCDFTKKRTSIRLAAKINATKYDNVNNIKNSKNYKKKNVVALGLAGKRLLKKNGNDSPSTANTKRVLNVLNSGNTRELEMLQTIGAKTAQQVVLFRQIRGNLKKISDLSQMPGWGGKKFGRFVDLNFLKVELL